MIWKAMIFILLSAYFVVLGFACAIGIFLNLSTIGANP